MKSPKVWVIDIIQATETIERLLVGYEFKAFSEDERTNLAVTKLIENIGEACNHLIDDFQDDYPQIPWRKIIAMRNRLIHEYWDIDYKVLWRVANSDAPSLRKDLLSILDQLPGPQEIEENSN